MPLNSLSDAQKRLESFKQKTLSESERERETIELAALLLQEALKVQTGEERRGQEELARMMQDPHGKAFTMMMTDECFRSHRTGRVANQLIYLLKIFGVPQFLNWFEGVQLRLFKMFGQAFHFMLVPLAVKGLRKKTSKVILPGEPAALSRHMEERRKEGVRLNLNHLGEAILSEQEATRRLKVYLHDLEQPDIEYISIKISTIFSQINLMAWEQTIATLSSRLKQLYRVAKAHKFKRFDGSEVAKFVNLDMEEYRDLHITKELFKRVLDEPEFFNYSAGIVLQAYLPDSYNLLVELTEWGMDRRRRGGAPVKVRIVKGANLAMEQVEASLHDWPQAPYKTKHEVDANYKRMVTYAAIKEHADAVHIGVASHNLFDIAYALIVRAEKGVEKQFNFEMLEGMADHMRKVVQKLSNDMLLYCPVATKEDFQSAIAYLIRRLDENTGPENFLRHSFGLKPGTTAWEEQVHLFTRACKEMKEVSSTPRRHQNRYEAPEHLPMNAPFKCESDTDLYLPQNQKWGHELIDKWKKIVFQPLPLVIDGKYIHRDKKGQGNAPSDPHEKLYEYSLATWEDIDYALNTAKANEKSWSSTPVHKRCELISAVARKMREQRADLIGVMMLDGGKTIFESEPEVSETIDFAEYYLRSMQHFDEMKDVSFKADGTVLVAPPWNFPVSIAAGGVIAGLISGNCVLFKPPPEAVLSGWILVNMFWEAGIPKNVLQFINCEDEPIGSKLIKDERVNTVILTGGTATALLFKKLRPNLHLCAETGGKNALIITGMSDRDLAIKDLLHSAFSHSGQKCSAASLAVLEAEVYDDPHFLRQLKDAVESIPVGHNWDLNAKVVPLIRPAEGALLKAFTTLEPGEEWLVTPKQDKNNPNLWSPGVKLGVKEGSFMHQTELFGPCLSVMRARNLEHALQIANGTRYGLTSGIHSLDKREITRWIQEIEAGNCYVNRTITGAIVERQPFGGTKESCFGHGSKAGGPNYILQFMHKKELSLPKEKGPIPDSLHALSDMLNSDKEIWTASIGSYANWFKYFSTDHDPQKIVGQDNFQRYVPRKNMGLRIQKGDRPLDLLRIFAAAWICKTTLHVSYDKNSAPLKSNWDRHFNQFHFIEESEEAFVKRLENRFFERVRLASPPTQAMILAASKTALYINSEPVLSNGRLELLHYLREVSLSIDYHRYGNLGLREGETRSPVL